MTFTDANGTPLSLVLYKYDGCPYCERVMAFADEAGLALPMRDTRAEPGVREELVQIGGKGQVPCLVINGRPMYESADIIRFLKTVVSAA